MKWLTRFNRAVTVDPVAADDDMTKMLIELHTFTRQNGQTLEDSSLVFSPKAGYGRNQSPVRRPVWLWHTAF